MPENQRPYSMKPRFLGQPMWWWLGNENKDMRELFGIPTAERRQTIAKRFATIYRRYRNVRPRPIVCAKQIYTRGRNGYTLSDTWSLDYYLNSWLPQALEDLKDGSGHPGSLDCGNPHDGSDNGHCDGQAMWNDILDKIRDGFLAARKIESLSYYERGTPWDEVPRREALLMDEFNEGMDLFKEWYFHLWD